MLQSKWNLFASVQLNILMLVKWTQKVKMICCDSHLSKNFLRPHAPAKCFYAKRTDKK